MTLDADASLSPERPDEPRCTLLVLKVASRCNLNCSYCYVYNAGDRSYLRQPAVMSDETTDALISRVVEHCRRHRLTDFTFVFHGGEPLLAGKRFFQRFVAQVAMRFPAETAPRFCMQSNGTLLTAEWCRLLKDLDIGLGISLDGPKKINDAHRVDHFGAGSYDLIRSNWDLALSCGLRPGILTVINLEADPIELYQHLKELRPRSVDFLFPDATHDKPPLQYSPHSEATPYADWLMQIFLAWVSEESSPFRIRLFSYLIRAILGCRDRLDVFNQDPNQVMVIETDGGIESLDVLKVCKEGITRTHTNVRTHELDSAFDCEMIKLYYQSGVRLCATCHNCLIKTVCAGGYLPHRYQNETAFDNPSVYCSDLMKLITGIQNWVVANLPGELLAATDLAPITYAEARAHMLSVR